MGNLQDAWEAIKSVREKVESHDKDIHAIKLQQDSMLEKQNDTCAQLKSTEEKMCKMMDDKHIENQEQLKEILTDIKTLMAEHHQAKGRAQAVSWVPTLVSTVVGLSSLGGVLWALAKITAKLSGIQ